MFGGVILKITLPNTKPPRVISVKHSPVLPDDGSHKIPKHVGVIFNFVSFKLLYNVVTTKNSYVVFIVNKLVESAELLE